jgi:hypothetical protein
VASSVIPLIFVLFVVVIVGAVVFGSFQAKKRREGMAAFAASRGWTYAESDDSLLDRIEC